MQVAWSIFIALLIGSPTIRAFFVPDNQELTYEYVARVTSEQIVSRPVGSSFLLQFELTLSNLGQGHDTLLRLKNVKHSFANGRLEDGFAEPPEDAPAEAANDLLSPFVIRRNSRGQSLSILADRNDSDWSLDIKRGVASLLQLDKGDLNADNINVGYVEAQEFSVYGKCPTLYSVVSKSADEYTIEKQFDPIQCGGFEWRFDYNLDAGHCEKPYANPISASGRRTYEVRAIGEEFVVNSANATNSIYLSAFGGNSDVYRVEVQHWIEKIKSENISEETQIDVGKMVERKLKVDFPQEEGNLFDLIGGRAKYIMKSIPDKIIEGFSRVLKHLNGEIRVNYDNYEETVHFIVQQLKMLDRDNLEVLLDTATKKGLRPLLLQSLPTAGTRTVALFIRDLIMQGRVSLGEARFLVGSLSFYIRHPSGETLKDLLLLKSAMDDVMKNAYYLSLATIVSKVVRRSPHDPSAHAFIDDLVEKFKFASRHEDRLLCLSALKNTKSDRAVEFLERVIANDGSVPNVTAHWRSLAIWACGDRHARSSALGKYWTMLKDPNEHLEVRAASLNVLMTNPTLETLNHLATMATGDAFNDDLYSLFSTNLQSMAQSTSPCFEESAFRARKILRSFRKLTSKKSRSFDHVFDFLDEFYKFGMLLRVSSIGNVIKDHFLILRIDLSAQIADFNLNQEQHYVRVFYTSESCLVNHKHLYRGESNLQYLNFLLAASDGRCLEIDIISSRNNRVTAITRISPSNRIRDIRSFIMENVLSFSNETNTFNGFGLKVVGDTTLPTDLGVPVTFFLQMATTFKHTYAYGQVDRSRSVFTYDLTQLNHQIYGLQFYNPIIDVWQGVRRNHLSDTRIPFNVTFGAKDGIKMTNGLEERIREYKYETYVFSQTFIAHVKSDEPRKILQTCKGCNAFVNVTTRSGDRVNKILWQHDCPLTDTVYEVAVFDCERSTASSRIAEAKKSFLGTHNKNFGKFSLLRIPMAMRHVWAYMTTSPSPGSCGLRVEARPRHTDFVLTPGRDASFDVKFFNGSDLTSAWSFDADIHPDESTRGRLKDLSLNFTRTHPRANQICVQSHVDETKPWKKVRQFEVYASEDANVTCSFEKSLIKGKSVQKLVELDNRAMDALYEDAFDECIASGQTLGKCIAQQTYYDRYAYEMIYDNIPESWIRLLKATEDNFDETFGGIASRTYRSKLGNSSEYKIVAEYRPLTAEPNVFVSAPSYDVKYDTMSIQGTPWKAIFDRQSALLDWYYDWDAPLATYWPSAMDVSTCQIEGNSVVDVHGNADKYLNAEWKKMLASQVKEGDNQVTIFGIEARNTDDILELRFNVSTNAYNHDELISSELIIQRSYDGINLVLNKKPLKSEEGYHAKSPLKYKKTKNLLVLQFVNRELYVAVDKTSTRISMKTNSDSTGLCYEGTN